MTINRREWKKVRSLCLSFSVPRYAIPIPIDPSKPGWSSRNIKDDLDNFRGRLNSKGQLMKSLHHALSTACMTEFQSFGVGYYVQAVDAVHAHIMTWMLAMLEQLWKELCFIIIEPLSIDNDIADFALLLASPRSAAQRVTLP